MHLIQTSCHRIQSLKILFCRNLQRRSVVSRGLHDRRVHWRHRRKSHLHALPLRKYTCNFAHPIRAFMTSFGFRFTTKSIKCRWRKSIKSRDIQTASWSGRNNIRAWELLFVLWSNDDLLLYALQLQHETQLGLLVRKNVGILRPDPDLHKKARR